MESELVLNASCVIDARASGVPSNAFSRGLTET
jgi:hypothetical protein